MKKSAALGRTSAQHGDVAIISIFTVYNIKLSIFILEIVLMNIFDDYY